MWNWFHIRSCHNITNQSSIYRFHYKSLFCLCSFSVYPARIYFFSANYFISADTYIVFLFRFQFLYFSRSSFLLLNKNWFLVLFKFLVCGNLNFIATCTFYFAPFPVVETSAVVAIVVVVTGIVVAGTVVTLLVSTSSDTLIIVICGSRVLRFELSVLSQFLWMPKNLIIYSSPALKIQSLYRCNY